jgi:Cof subfamily protein (haloacid dehalogenase superfamily)
MIFFDIDGTLLDHNKQLPSSTKKAIQVLKEVGHEVALATGRAPFLFKELREELEIDSFVSFNGQYVVLKGEVIYKSPLKKHVLQSLTEYAGRNNHPLVYMDHETMTANIKYHSHIEESLRTINATHPEYNPDYFIDKEIYQTLLFCNDNKETLYQEDFKDLKFVRWHPFSLDVISLGESKANGIEKIIDRLGFKKEQIYAFGDGLNDIEMLQFVENSVAMGNAHYLAKNAARYITKDVSEDGILYGLELVGLL